VTSLKGRAFVIITRAGPCFCTNNKARILLLHKSVSIPLNFPYNTLMPGNKALAGSHYTKLLSDIRREIAGGIAAIERRRIKTYWNVGRYISGYLSHRENPYGTVGRFYQKLSSDININQRTLQQCEQFYRYFPHLAIQTGFSWSHYRYLLALPEKKEREKWMRRAAQNQWTSNDLRFSLMNVAPQEGHASSRLSVPARGLLYAYRLVKDEGLRWMVDIGFANRIEAPASAGKLNNKYLYASEKTEKGYCLKVIDAAVERLYTFQACLLRVVDADTLIVRIDQGFGVWTEQSLRLRGIDAPELSTLAGRKAKHWVEEQIGQEPRLVVKTYKADKYDRYLVDVFYLPGCGDPHQVAREGIYLNQQLLDNRLAEVYK